MYWMGNRRSVEALQDAGFNKWQIHRLCQLQKKYQGGEREQDQAQVSLDLARLQFARWLFRTGKLTDQLPQ